MPTTPISPPAPTARIDLIVDWLELSAFFDDYSTARIDEIVAILEEQSEFEDDDNLRDSARRFGDEAIGDIGYKDRALDALREAIENEFEVRAQESGDAYPFELSGDGEQLVLRGDWNDPKFAAYLTCLLTSHLTNSSLFDFELPNNLKQRLRNRVFQVISTLALAGKAGGGASSIGWPRESKASIIRTLKRAGRRKSSITVRSRARPYTRPNEKDGGIDVLAWKDEIKPPPTVYYYGQAASGHNWHGKSVRNYVKTFERNYMSDPPRTNVNYATLLPFRIMDNITWMAELEIHGDILERTRLPFYVNRGLELASRGVKMDESENIHQVTDWIGDMREAALNSMS